MLGFGLLGAGIALFLLPCCLCFCCMKLAANSSSSGDTTTVYYATVPPQTQGVPVAQVVYNGQPQQGYGGYRSMG